MNFSSGYIYLFLAIILGISANGFLKTTNGFTNVFPTIFCVVSIVLCLFCLSKAMNIIPVGFTYATYGGLTITAVTIFGILKYNQLPNIYHHIGIYEFSVSTLETFTNLEQSNNEKRYKLEQLRAMDNNIKINVSYANTRVIGIDTQEDFIELKKIMEYKS